MRRQADEPDECPDPEGWDAPNSLTPSFKIGCIMLVFRVAPDPKEPKVGRDFVLVREMALADRDPNGPFPRLPSEEPAKAESGPGFPESGHSLGHTSQERDPANPVLGPSGS